jgi:hypothetical protein
VGDCLLGTPGENPGMTRHQGFERAFNANPALAGRTKVEQAFARPPAPVVCAGPEHFYEVMRWRPILSNRS